MKFNSLVKYDKIQGKTVREIEEAHLSGGKNYGILLVLGTSILVLMVLFIGWQINSKIVNLRVDNKNLIAENTTLKKEVSALKNQIASTKMMTANKIPPKESEPAVTNQNKYVYYVIRSKDTLGDISNKYYGVPIYGPGLAELNGLSINSMLQVGQIIKVPLKPDGLKS